jgi:glutamate/tyrosine decarboxylase-like PLP-dependent enzyme
LSGPDSEGRGEARHGLAAAARSEAEIASNPFRELLDLAARQAGHYLDEVQARPVFPHGTALAGLAAFEESLPALGSDPADVLRTLAASGGPATVAQMGGRYFGFVNGGALPVGLAALWLGDAWDQNAAHYVMSPIAARLEEVCEAWLAELLGLPTGCAAGFVTGTMLANFSGLAAARGALYRKQGIDIAEAGLYGAAPLRVVLGAGAHAAVYKALALLGMGRSRVEVVPADAQGALALEHLPQLDAQTLVVLQAGNVNTGAFDPIGAVCERAQAAGAWVHVDGAFGLWARASAQLARHTQGWEHADSWAMDAHKTLNAPYDCGIVLCRDRAALTGAFEAAASYFVWGAEREGMRYTPSMSKRARAVELWAILKSLGRSGVGALVDQLCERARFFADLLAAEGFRIHNDVVFNQVLVSSGDEPETAATLERVQNSGECWCGGSTFGGRQVIRLSVCSWRTTEDDVRRSVRAFVAAREAARSGSEGAVAAQP